MDCFGVGGGSGVIDAGFDEDVTESGVEVDPVVDAAAASRALAASLSAAVRSERGAFDDDVDRDDGDGGCVFAGVAMIDVLWEN